MLVRKSYCCRLGAFCGLVNLRSIFIMNIDAESRLTVAHLSAFGKVTILKIRKRSPKKIGPAIPAIVFEELNYLDQVFFDFRHGLKPDNVLHNQAAAVDAPIENARPAAPRSCLCYPAICLGNMLGFNYTSDSLSDYICQLFWTRNQIE